MKIKGFNEANSESLFLFFEEQEATKTYYRIGLEYLCEILGIEHMSSKDVEDSEEYKKKYQVEIDLTKGNFWKRLRRMHGMIKIQKFGNIRFNNLLLLRFILTGIIIQNFHHIYLNQEKGLQQGLEKYFKMAL